MAIPLAIRSFYGAMSGIGLALGEVCGEYNRITSRMLRVRGQRQSFVGLSTVRISHADPSITYLLIVHHRIVDLDVEAEPLHR